MRQSCVPEKLEKGCFYTREGMRWQGQPGLYIMKMFYQAGSCVRDSLRAAYLFLFSNDHVYLASCLAPSAKGRVVRTLVT